MNAVGIDVSKGKSTVAILRPQGIVVASPYDVPHTGSSLKELAMVIKKLHGETRVVMEATGNYYEPIARFLHEQGIFVSVVTPMLISDFGGNTLRRSEHNYFEPSGFKVTENVRLPRIVCSSLKIYSEFFWIAIFARFKCYRVSSGN